MSEKAKSLEMFMADYLSSEENVTAYLSELLWGEEEDDIDGKQWAEGTLLTLASVADAQDNPDLAMAIDSRRMRARPLRLHHIQDILGALGYELIIRKRC